MGVLPLVAGKDYKAEMTEDELSVKLPKEFGDTMKKRFEQVKEKFMKDKESGGGFLNFAAIIEQTTKEPL